MAKKKVVAKKVEEQAPKKPELSGFLLQYAQKLKFTRNLQYMLLEFIQLALEIDREAAMEISSNMERPE